MSLRKQLHNVLVFFKKMLLATASRCKVVLRIKEEVTVLNETVAQHLVLLLSNITRQRFTEANRLCLLLQRVTTLDGGDKIRYILDIEGVSFGNNLAVGGLHEAESARLKIDNPEQLLCCEPALLILYVTPRAVSTTKDAKNMWILTKRPDRSYQ